MTYLSSVLSNIHFTATLIAIALSLYIIFSTMYSKIEENKNPKFSNVLLTWLLSSIIIAVITPSNLDRSYIDWYRQRYDELQQEKKELYEIAQKQGKEINKVSKFLVENNLGDAYEKFNSNYND